MKVLVLSEYGEAYALAQHLVEEGHDARYFQYRWQDERPGWVGADLNGVWHVDSWRPAVGGMDVVICDGPYFSQKYPALVDVPLSIGCAGGLPEMFVDVGNILFRGARNTMPFEGRQYRPGIVWGYFDGSDWVHPFRDIQGRVTREARRVGPVALGAFSRVLAGLEYTGPLQAVYTTRRKAIYIIDLPRHFGYGILMKVCRDADVPIMEFFADPSVLPVEELKRWWRLGRSG